MAPSARRHQGKPLPTGGGTPVDTASARHDKQPRRNSRFGGQSPFLTSWASLSATCGRVSRVAKGADCKSGFCSPNMYRAVSPTAVLLGFPAKGLSCQLPLVLRHTMQSGGNLGGNEKAEKSQGGPGEKPSC